MKRSIRFLSAVLCFLMLLTSVPAPAGAARDAKGIVGKDLNVVFILDVNHSVSYTIGVSHVRQVVGFLTMDGLFSWNANNQAALIRSGGQDVSMACEMTGNESSFMAALDGIRGDGYYGPRRLNEALDMAKQQIDQYGSPSARNVVILVGNNEPEARIDETMESANQVKQVAELFTVHLRRGPDWHDDPGTAFYRKIATDGFHFYQTDVGREDVNADEFESSVARMIQPLYEELKNQAAAPEPEEDTNLSFTIGLPGLNHVAVGTSVAVTATGNVTGRDRTFDCVWSVSDPTLARVELTGSGCVLHGIKPGYITLYADWNGVRVRRRDVQVTQLYIYPDVPEITMTEGEARNLQAFLRPTEEELRSSDAKWTSSNDGVVKSLGNGKIQAVREGKATISVAHTGWGRKETASIVVHVLPGEKWLEVAPNPINLEKGKSTNVTVKLMPSGENVTGKANLVIVDTAVASLYGNKVTGKMGGTTKLTVSYEGLVMEVPVNVSETATTAPPKTTPPPGTTTPPTGTTTPPPVTTKPPTPTTRPPSMTLNNGIRISPRNVKCYVGDTVKFTAKQIYPSKKIKPDWSVTDTAIGTITSEGMFTAKKIGTVEVVGISSSKMADRVTVNVVPRPMPVYRAFGIDNNEVPGFKKPNLDDCRDIYYLREMLRSTQFNGAVTTRAGRTASQIKSDIKKAFKDAKSTDISLFYYSGKGYRNKKGTTISLVDKKGAYMNIKTLRSELQKIPGKIYVILDMDFSGGFISKGAGGAPDIAQEISDIFQDEQETVFTKKLTGKKFTVLTATTEGQNKKFEKVIFDYVSGFTFQLYHSVRYTVITADELSRWGMADKNRDETITFQEMFDYAAPKVRSKYGTVVKMYPASKNNEPLFIWTNAADA